MSTETVLVLNADYSPLRVVSWKRAVVMLFDDKAALVEAYAGRAVRSATFAMPFPAVVALRRYQAFRTRIRFNRQNVLARDGYACAYCGARPRRASGRPDLAELTLDHVVPRSKSREGRVTLPSGAIVPVTGWENVVTACVACNCRKADQTPAEARMPLRARPRTPSGVALLRMAVLRVDVPEEWVDWLPKGHPWRDYWTEELTS